MKYCLIKQDVYQDLYITSNDVNNVEKLFTSMMRVGPFGLIQDLSADFYIIKEENTEECQIYNHFLRGFGGNYKLLKTQPLNNIPGNEFFEPGTTKPNGQLSVNVEDIDWSKYDIVISINFSVPSNILKLHKNTLWCYLIGENNLNLLDNPKYGYDIALNQDVVDNECSNDSNVVLFPYTFLNDNTLYNLLNKYFKKDKQGGLFVEINSCRGRPITSYPHIFDKICNLHNMEVLTHKQNIKDNLINLYNSKYFVKYGGRNIRGNSIIEAISSGSLVLMNPRSSGYGFLIGDECHVSTEEDIIKKIEHFEKEPEKYKEALNIQKRLLKKYCFDAPINHLEYQWYKKISKAVVFVANLPYFGNFITSLIQLHDVGKYQGPVILIAADDLYETEHLNNPNIKKYNVLGHSDIAPLRKLDPGENFPWKLLSSKGLSIWFSKKQERNYEFKDSQKRVIFFKNIFKIGYRYFNLSNRNKGDVRIIKAFQMRFLPEEVSGKITDKTLYISQLLAK